MAEINEVFNVNISPDRFVKGCTDAEIGELLILIAHRIIGTGSDTAVLIPPVLPVGRVNGWSRDDVDQLKKLKAEGCTMQQIAKRIGRTTGSIGAKWKEIKDAGVSEDKDGDKGDDDGGG